jgi:hypothetical protein
LRLFPAPLATSDDAVLAANENKTKGDGDGAVVYDAACADSLGALRDMFIALDARLPESQRERWHGVAAQLAAGGGGGGGGVLDASALGEKSFRHLVHGYQGAAWHERNERCATSLASHAKRQAPDDAEIARWNDDVRVLGWWDEASGGVWAWSERAAVARTTAQVACVVCGLRKALTPPLVQERAASPASPSVEKLDDAAP